jgi:hypothetical protein
MKNARGMFELVVLLSNGVIKFLKPNANGGDHMDIDESTEFKIPGKILHFQTDKEESQWAFVLVKTDDGSVQFWSLHHRKASRLED